MATDFTAHYHLDKYVATDKPNLRDQYNAAMDKIDDAVYTASINATDAKTAAQRAEAAVAGKADQTALDSLSQTVAGKADQTALDSLSQTVAGKASTQALNALGEIIPATDFSAQNTVKDALDLKADKSEVITSPSSLAACDYLGTIPYLTADETAVWNHAGSICSNGQYEIMISCPIPQPADNTGIVRFVSVKNDSANVIPAKTVQVGHANSITYVATTNEYYIIPLTLMQGDTLVNTDEIWIYNSNFTSRRTVTCPAHPTAISCDPKSGRIFIETDPSEYVTEFYELVGNQFILMGTADIRSADSGRHVQDLACYDGMWYASNTVGNIVYGTMEPFAVVGNFDISKRCTMSEYFLFGEVDGFDFTPDGHLLCTGDFSLSENSLTYGYVHTIFEIIYPTSKVSPIYVTRHEGSNHTTFSIDGNFNRLRQWDALAAPQLAIPISRQIGSIYRAVLNADITTGSMCFDEFAEFILETNGHTLTANEIRMDGEARYTGNGTLKVNKLTAPAKDMLNVSFGGNISIEPANPAAFFNNLATGATIKCGGLRNPNDVKFPGTTVSLSGDNVYIGTGTLRTKNGVVS